MISSNNISPQVLNSTLIPFNSTRNMQGTQFRRFLFQADRDKLTPQSSVASSPMQFYSVMHTLKCVSPMLKRDSVKIGVLLLKNKTE